MAASRERWNEHHVAPWRDVVPRLERHMEQAEWTVGEVETVRGALQCVIDIESSEINDVFSSVIAASDACFVKHIRVFHEAEKRHLDYIAEQITALDPELGPASRGLTKQAAVAPSVGI